MLNIQLLGGLELIEDGRRLELPRSQRLEALLGRLVLKPGTSWSRTRLAAHFWPNSSEEQAHTNLRKVIYDVRKVLPGPERFLQMQGSTISWREDAPYTSDVAIFTVAAQEALSTDALARAVALYTGDLLPNCEDDEMDHERTRLRQIFRDLLERAIADGEARQDYAAARAYAQRLQAHDALYEPAYQHLIRLHALNGDRAAAIQTYQVCKDMLRDEFDAQPSPATDGLLEQVLDGQFKVAAGPSLVRPPIPASTALPQPSTGSKQASAAPERPRWPPVWTFLSWTHLYRALLERAVRLLGSEMAAFLPGNASLPLPNGRSTVTMKAEAAEATPGSFIAVRGACTGIPRRVLMWTVVHTNGYFWPQSQALRFGVRWTGYARIGDSRADSGKRLEVMAVLVERQTASEFRQWLRNGDRNGRYPPMTSLSSGAQIAARVEVTVT